MKKDYLWIGLVCVILGVILAQQAKTVQRDMLDGLSPRQKSGELVTELQKVRDEKEVLLEQISALEERIKEIESSESKENVLIKTLNEELERYKMFAGLSDVEGQGIVITIDNPPVDMNYAYDTNFVYDYHLLLSLVNELNAAGAEAISINDQRITGRSEIRAAGNAININLIPQQAPFVIKAIGSSDTLDGAVSHRFGIVSQIRDKRYLIEVKKSDNVRIPKFSRIVDFRHADVIQ
ncbi:DUF881 domain-containing protein [Fusibacter sp. JL216-2]|uniref:DUF881 domain-containing protein n=1 Tax=Fusibacter sp. JL216-2 TaxID=3071453 RepID=UPI003D3289AA